MERGFADGSGSARPSEAEPKGSVSEAGAAMLIARILESRNAPTAARPDASLNQTKHPSNKAAVDAFAKALSQLDTSRWIRETKRKI